MAHSLPLFRRPVRARFLARFGGVPAALVVLLSGWGISTAAAASVAPSAAVGAIGHDVSTPHAAAPSPRSGRRSASWGSTAAAAKAFTCSTSFTGAAAQMVQFVDGSGLDANYVCRRA